jgi:chloride channel protein, CIC family
MAAAKPRSRRAGRRAPLLTSRMPRAIRRARVTVRSTWRFYRLFCYAILVGILGGLGARAFIWMLELGERLFMGGIAGYVPPALGVANPAPVFGGTSLWLIPLSTTIGALLCGLLVYSTAPEAEGHGTDAAIASYHYRGSRVRPIVPLIKAIASSITIGSGGAAGREGPAAQISSGTAAVLCDILRVPLAERRILVLSGMAAGLSAIFRAPLGMAIFASEVLYAGLAFEYEALPYTLIAAVVAYAVNGLFVGWDTLFVLPAGLAFTRPVELIGYAILGVAAGVVGAIQPTVFYGVRDAFARLKLPRHLKPAIGGLLMGLLAMAFPQTLATGFGWVQMALTGGYTGYVLLILVIAKILAMSLTVASGGSGGVFGPNVYIGGMLGGGIASVMNVWFPGSHFLPTAFVVVGMGAVFAGTARVPVSTLIMVVEMTGGYGLVVPSMLASAMSFMVQRTLGARMPYPRLYESQVETRLDSPVHHPRIARGIFALFERAGSLKSLAGVNPPALASLLRSGRSINIFDAQGRVFAFLVSMECPLIGREASETLGSALVDLVLIGVIRDGRLLVSARAGKLRSGDSLILAGPEQAHDRFLSMFRPLAPQSGPE